MNRISGYEPEDGGLIPSQSTKHKKERIKIMNTQELFEQFRQWRKSNKVPLRKIGAETGIYFSILNKIEHGKVQNISYDKGVRLKSFLDRWKDGYIEGCTCPKKKNDGSAFDGISYGCQHHGR